MCSESERRRGYIYVLTNPSFPQLLKVGKPTVLPKSEPLNYLQRQDSLSRSRFFTPSRSMTATKRKVSCTRLWSHNDTALTGNSSGYAS